MWILPCTSTKARTCSTSCMPTTQAPTAMATWPRSACSRPLPARSSRNTRSIARPSPRAPGSPPACRLRFARRAPACAPSTTTASSPTASKARPDEFAPTTPLPRAAALFNPYQWHIGAGRTAGYGGRTRGRNLQEMQFVKRMLGTSILLALSAAAGAADAPKFDPQRLSDEVKTLTSDAFEGRGPATPAEQKTIDYVGGQFKAAGLQPGGDLKDGRREWTQAVPLYRAEIKGPVSANFVVGKETVPLTQGQQVASRASMDGSKSVAIDKAPLVFCGYGVKAPERNWDDFKGVDLHGKIAIVLVNDPDFETGKATSEARL